MAVRRLRLRSAACGVLGALIVAAPAAARAPTGSGELIVGFREGVSQAEQARALAPWAGKVRKRWTRIDGVLAAMPATQVAAARKALEQDPRVEYVEPNYVLRASTSDPHFNLL